MMNPFVPLELDLIDEGRFVGRINEALRACQTELVEHIKEHEGKAKGATATVKMAVRLKCEDPESITVSVQAKLERALPAPPPNVTMAMAGEDDQGPCLFVRRTGSKKDHPAQATLCTEDGQTVDLETGEIQEPVTV